MPFVLTVTFSKAPYDLELEIVGHDIGMTSVEMTSVLVSYPDETTETRVDLEPAEFSPYQHYFSEDGERKQVEAVSTRMVVPDLFRETGKHRVQITGKRIGADGTETPFQFEKDLRIRMTREIATHRGLAGLGGV